MECTNPSTTAGVCVRDSIQLLTIKKKKSMEEKKTTLVEKVFNMDNALCFAFGLVWVWLLFF